MQERECYSITKPKGVIAVIAPWNFPFAIASAWTSAPAILEGNVVILKPSEDAPLTGQLIKDLYDEADFPEGVFNLIQGDGETGKFLIKDDQVDHICFTGSVETGKYIRNICANSEHTTCSCEMGSKSAVIVFEDANFDLAINSCLNSAFKLSGQRCVSAGRLLIQRTIFEKFKEQFLEEVKKIKVGDPFLVYQDFCIGPIINESQMHRVMKYNDLVKNLNASVKTFPSSILASIFGVKERAYFEVTDEAKVVPKVDFTE
jgi:aldehyde dehydrogenase (NAD+)